MVFFHDKNKGMNDIEIRIILLIDKQLLPFFNVFRLLIKINKYREDNDKILFHQVFQCNIGIESDSLTTFNI